MDFNLKKKNRKYFTIQSSGNIHFTMHLKQNPLYIQKRLYTDLYVLWILLLERAILGTWEILHEQASDCSYLLSD